jgi:hypothetical protein
MSHIRKEDQAKRDAGLINKFGPRLLSNRAGSDWTAEEEDILTNLWGSRSVRSIAERIGRTPVAVYHRVRKLGYHNRTGSMSMTKLCKMSGFDDEQIKTAMEAIGLPLSRDWERKGRGNKSRTRWYRIDEDDAERIIEWLISRFNEYGRIVAVDSKYVKGWGTGGRPNACLKCGTTERPHFGNGLCKNCHRVCWYRSSPNFKNRYGGWGTGIRPNSCLVCGTIERPHVAKGMCGRCHGKEWYRCKKKKKTLLRFNMLDSIELQIDEPCPRPCGKDEDCEDLVNIRCACKVTGIVQFMCLHRKIMVVRSGGSNDLQKR